MFKRFTALIASTIFAVACGKNDIPIENDIPVETEKTQTPQETHEHISKTIEEINKTFKTETRKALAPLQEEIENLKQDLEEAETEEKKRKIKILIDAQKQVIENTKTEIKELRHEIIDNITLLDPTSDAFKIAKAEYRNPNAVVIGAKYGDMSVVESKQTKPNGATESKTLAHGKDAQGRPWLCADFSIGTQNSQAVSKAYLDNGFKGESRKVAFPIDQCKQVKNYEPLP